MKKVNRKGFIFYNEKVKQIGKEKTFQFYNDKKERIPFQIVDDGEMISLFQNKKYVYKTYSQKANKWRMMDNIIERL